MKTVDENVVFIREANYARDTPTNTCTHIELIALLFLKNQPDKLKKNNSSTK